MSLNKSSWNECIKILTWPSTKWEKNILYVSERAKYKSTYWNLANYLVKVLCLNLFFYCIKIYDALLYQTHLSPTNAAANNSQMWHSMPVYLFDIKHSTVVVLQYRVFHPNLAVLTWQQIFGDWVKGRRGRILWAFKLLLLL